MLDQFKALEQRAGGPQQAAAVLGIAYQGMYCAHKRNLDRFGAPVLTRRGGNVRVVPLYIERSLRAHLALSDRQFKKILAIALA